MTQELIGSMIDRYLLQHHLTRGGMSEIYLALDTQTQSTVALKLVHSSNHDYCERFQREVKTIALLEHNHILPALSYGDYNDWCYMVMPYIEYGTLNRKLANGPLSLEDAGRVLEQLSDALQYAHDRGIIHRDIKPTNVLLQDGEHVYLADFGLVKRVGDDNGLTVTGYLIGTAEYMAPELAEEPASAKSDQYALGILLYQMLTGHVPFIASTPIATYLKQIRERPEAPSDANPALPESIGEVILRALQKEPRHRYATVRDFAQAYKQALETVQKPVLIHARQETRWPLRETKTRAIQPGHLLKPAHIWAVLVAVVVFCIVPLLLGLSISSLYGQTPQSPEKRLHVTAQKTERQVSPGATSTRSGSAAQQRKSVQLRTTSSRPPQSIPASINQNNENENIPTAYGLSDDEHNNDGNGHGHGHGNNNGGNGHGNGNAYGHHK